MPEKKKKPMSLDEQLAAMKEEFKDDESKPWQQVGKPAKPEPKPAPKPKPKPKPFRIGYPGPSVKQEPLPDLQEDVQDQVARIKSARRPVVAVGKVADTVNTGATGAAAMEIRDAARFKKLLEEERKIEPEGAEARARKRMK